MKIARLPLLLLFFTACHDNDGNNKEGAAAIPLQAPLSKSPSENPVWTPPNTVDPIDGGSSQSPRAPGNANERLERLLHTTDSIVFYRQPENVPLYLWMTNRTLNIPTKTGNYTVKEYLLLSHFNPVLENGNLKITWTYRSSSTFSAMMVEVTGENPIIIEMPASNQAYSTSGFIPVKKGNSIKFKIISSYMSTIPEIKDLTITLFKDQ